MTTPSKVLLLIQLVLFVVGLIAASIASEVSGFVAIFLLIISVTGIAGAVAGFIRRTWSPTVLIVAWVLFLLLQILIIIEITKDSGLDSKSANLFISVSLTAGFLYYNYKLVRAATPEAH